MERGKLQTGAKLVFDEVRNVTASDDDDDDIVSSVTTAIRLGTSSKRRWWRNVNFLAERKSFATDVMRWN